MITYRDLERSLDMHGDARRICRVCGERVKLTAAGKIRSHPAPWRTVADVLHWVPWCLGTHAPPIDKRASEAWDAKRRRMAMGIIKQMLKLRRCDIGIPLPMILGRYGLSNYTVERTRAGSFIFRGEGKRILLRQIWFDAPGNKSHNHKVAQQEWEAAKSAFLHEASKACELLWAAGQEPRTEPKP